MGDYRAQAPDGALPLRTNGLHVPSVVVAAMFTAVLVNVAQYYPIDADTSTQYEGVSVKGGHDLLALVEGHFESTQERFLLYVQLRDLAPGAEIVLPPGLRSRERLRGLALSGPLVQGDGPPELTAELQAELDAATVTEGVDELLGAYALAVLPPPVERLVVVPADDVVYVVDARLLDRAGE